MLIRFFVEDTSITHKILSYWDKRSAPGFLVKYFYLTGLSENYLHTEKEKRINGGEGRFRYEEYFCNFNTKVR